MGQWAPRPLAAKGVTACCQQRTRGPLAAELVDPVLLHDRPIREIGRQCGTTAAKAPLLRANVSTDMWLTSPEVILRSSVLPCCQCVWHSIINGVHPAGFLVSFVRRSASSQLRAHVETCPKSSARRQLTLPSQATYRRSARARSFFRTLPASAQDWRGNTSECVSRIRLHASPSHTAWRRHPGTYNLA